jgi:hypothetical protein
MKTIKEVLDGKVWKAVEAMIKGLEMYDKAENFVINMGTFGTAKDNICYGCAATCAVMKIYGKSYPYQSISDRFERAAFIETEDIDLIYFEESINSLRQGFLHPILTYFDKADVAVKYSYEYDLEFLTSANWKQAIAPYKQLRDFLKQNDI